MRTRHASAVAAALAACLLAGPAAGDDAALGAATPTATATPTPFPVPSPDGKPLATADQRSVRVPLRFARVERFYREHFAGAKEVTLRATEEDGRRVLTIVSRRRGDAWARAVVREDEVATSIEVTPLLQLDAARVEGTGLPLVQVVLGRSEEAARAADQIDHVARD